MIGFSYQRFRSHSSSQTSPKVTRAALSPQVALVVLDGLREDRFLALMPRTRRIAEARGTVCGVQTPPITFTIAGIYTLGTGDMPSHALVPENFQSHAVRVDSLPNAITRAGGTTSLFGEKIWQDLYGAWAKSETSRDRGPFAEHDRTGFDRLAEATRDKTCNLCVMHDPQVDAIAHRGGVFSEEYARYVDEVDTKLASMVDSRTTWMITSDHGMLDSGGHGGDEALARASFLAAWGPGIRHGGCGSRIAQADIPTSAAVLLGAPIPFSSQGTVPAFVAVEDRAALATELSEHKNKLGVPPSETQQTLFMLLAIVPMLVALFGLLIAGGTTWRVELVLLAAPLVAFGWVFANVIYHHVSYGTATLIAIGAAFVPFAAVRRTRLMIALAIGATVAAEAHWVAHIEALFLGFACFVALSDRPRAIRVAASLGVAAASFAIVESAWLSLFATRTISGLLVHALAIGATGAVAAMVFGRGRPASMQAAIAIGASLAYQVTTTAPSFMRPWLPLAAMAVLIALSPRGIALSLFDVIVGGLSVLFAMQASALHWVALCIVTLLATTSLATRTLDRHAWVRGGVLLAIGYALTVVEGNRLRFEDIHVLAGFLGGALELHLPLTATLVALYYAAPIVLLLAVSRWSGEPVRRTRATARAAAMLGLLKIAAMMVGFAWGRMAEGSWSMQLTELALLSTWVVVLLLAQPMLMPSRRERVASVYEVEAAVESKR
ncbi:MAG: alkaline phosphatase family protein [Polyangiales bacterium]